MNSVLSFEVTLILFVLLPLLGLMPWWILLMVSSRVKNQSPMLSLGESSSNSTA